MSTYPSSPTEGGEPPSRRNSLIQNIRAVPPKQWIVAVISGFLGSIPLGLMMQYGNPEPLIALALPNMYGLAGPNLLLGWTIHQFHGVTLAILVIAAVQWSPIRSLATTVRGALGLAVLVGLVTTALLSVLLMPLWLQAVGYPHAPGFPDLTMPEKAWSVGGHIVYALPVTIGYALLARE